MTSPGRPVSPAVTPALGRFIAGVNQDHGLPISTRPTAVRARLQAALACADFHVDCARTVLAQMSTDPAAEVLFADPEGRYTLQLFCWPAGFGNEPHRHDTWTVSGVLAGSLEVLRSSLSAADCRAAKPLVATPGQTGVLAPPQHHCLRNAGPETAISFHVFSAGDGAQRADFHGRAAPDVRFDDDDVLAIARLAVAKGGREARDCVRAAFSLVGPATRLDLVKLMLTQDPGEGIAMGRELASQVGGLDGHRLSSLLDGLEQPAVCECAL